MHNKNRSKTQRIIGSFGVCIAILIFIFIAAGFFFHTSKSPILFGKYSVSYFFGLLVIICLFLLYLKTIRYLYQVWLLKQYSNQRLKQYLLRFLLITVCIIAGVTGSEMYLRKQLQDVFPCLYASIANYDPYLQNKIDASNPCDRTLPVSKDGFRGTEISKQKPLNTFRIVVMGGSTVLSRTISWEETSVRILEKQLALYYPQKHIEVINAGNDWYSSEHSFIQYVFKIKDYSPDMIIMWHGINDLIRSCSPKGFSQGPYRSDYSHFLGPLSNIVATYFRRPTIIGYPDIFSNDLLVLRPFSSIIYSLKETLYSDFHWFSNENNMQRESIDLDITSFPSLQSYKRNITAFAKVMEIDGVRFLLATQPYLYRDNLNILEQKNIGFNLFCLNNNKYPSIRTMKKVMEEFNLITKDVSQTYHTDFVDLEQEVPKTIEYFKDDVHYTPRAEALIADALFRYIINHHLIP